MKEYREYYDLPEVAEAWGVSVRDVLRLGEMGQLRLSVFVHGVEVKRPDDRFTWLWEDGSIIAPIWNYGGLVDVFSHDVQIAARRGSVDISRMKDRYSRDLYVPSYRNPIPVLKDDLVLRGHERAEFEKVYSYRHPVAEEKHAEDGRVFRVSEDYSRAWLGEQEFTFGKKQAKVIRLLHEALHRGEPRQSGKQILGIAGARSDYIGDLFGKRLRWRSLIGSDGAGNYWLNVVVPDEEASPPSFEEFVENALSAE